MHISCRFAGIIILIGISCISYSQDISNRGTDFWVGYGSHVKMYNSNGSVDTAKGGYQDMILYFTSARQAHVTVEIPRIGWSQTYLVDSNTIVESGELPKIGEYDARLASEGVSNKGIHITSDEPIAAYCHIYSGAISGASVILPTNILGQDYYALNFKQRSNDDNSYSFCFVIATEDSTLIEVTPSVETQHYTQDSAFTIMLMKGQVLNLLGKLTGMADNFVYKGLDLTGTHIRSVSNNNIPAKKIAVFCGSSKISISCDNALSSADNLIAQMFPSDAWGKVYITVPTVNMPMNFYRVMVKDRRTVVKLNGKRLTDLVDNIYYEFQNNKINVIEADKNILVAQYITTQNQCGNTSIGALGDPEMIYLSSVEQKSTNVTLISPVHNQIVEHHINVVINTADTSTFTLDGRHAARKFEQLSGLPEISYATFNVNAGFHSLHADAGLNAYAYGYGNYESYGYNAGFYNPNFLGYLSINNPYAAPKEIRTCKATPFKMSAILLYQPESIQWDFMNNPALSPNNKILLDHPFADSVFVRSGQKYYLYSLKENYSINSTGTLPVKIYVIKKLMDGGLSLQAGNYNINVTEHPVASWQLNYDSCKNDTLHFFDNSNAFKDSIIQWQWNFDDGSYSNDRSPLKQYATYGNYNVTLRTITGIGCFADTLQTVALNPKPVARFKISGLFCPGNKINFEDASVIDRDKIISWNWNFNNESTSDLQLAEQVFKKSGNYNIKLSVTSNKNCTADTLIPLHIFDYPQVNIPNEIVVNENKSIQIKPVYTGNALQYKWKPLLYLDNDTIAYPIVTPQDNITYQLAVTENGTCTTTKNISIRVLHLLEVPNVFSPNGDGINDKWVMHNLGYFPGCSVDVFNRSGQKVFSATAYNNVWDGNYNGKPLPVGTYYYIIKTQDNAMPLKTGYVAILR